MQNERLVRRLARGFVTMLAANVLSILSKGLLLLILTRYLLTPDEFGLLFYAISVLAVARLFAELGIAKSTARYVAEFAERDESQVRHVVRMGLQYNLLTIMGVGVALLLFPDALGMLMGEPRLEPLLLVGSVYVAFRSLSYYARTVFQGFNEVQWSGLVASVSSVTQLVCVVVFVAFIGGPLGALVGYTVAFAVATAVGLVVLYRWFYSRLPESGTVRSDLRRRLLEYNVPLVSTRGAGVLTGKVDTILVGYFLTPTAVGFYSLGKQIAEFVITPASALGFVVSPTFSEQKAAQNLNRAARLYERSFENILLLYVPAAAGLILVATPAVRFVFGTAYIGAVPVIQVLAGFVVLKSIDKITNDGLDYLGRARERAVVKAVGATGNALLNILLIPWLGVVGAAVGTVISITGVVMTNVFLMHRELGLSVRRLAGTGVRTVGITGVLTVTVWLVRPYVTGIASLIGCVLLGVAVWAPLAIATGLLNVSEVRTFVENLS